MIDILNAIINGDINREEAEEVLDETVDKYHDDELKDTPQKELNLNKYEWTAIGFGIDLEVLATWRVNGWPTNCSNCGEKKNYKDFGWKIVDDKIVCVKCKDVK